MMQRHFEMPSPTPKSSVQPVLFDSHMHTPLCRHATGEPELYAQRGIARGLKGVTFTCHSPMPEKWYESVRMRPEELPQYLALVERARKNYGDDFEVRLGLESDYYPGMERWLEKLHTQAPFEYILGSIHFFGPEYGDRFGTWNTDIFVATYFNHLASAAETGLFDCLAHPDLIKNHKPGLWSVKRYQLVIANALDRIAATGVAMELNTSGLYKSVREMNPGLDFLLMMRRRNIPVVLGSDAHTPSRVGDQFELALRTLAEAGYRKVSQFRGRKIEQIDIAAALASLKTPALRVAALASPGR
jgi:histidinol-phosphatase (PHP family)